MTKRIEIYTLKDCEPCDHALRALIPFAEERQIRLDNIPLTDKDTDIVTVPRVCVIEEKEGAATRKCIEGYSEDLVSNVEELLDEVSTHGRDIRKVLEEKPPEGGKPTVMPKKVRVNP